MTFLYRAPSLAEITSIPVAGIENAGGKGNGLLRIPPAWYPPTAFLSPALHSAVLDGGSLQDLLSFSGVLEGLANVIATFGKLSTESRLMVRSDDSGEDILHRGAYE